MWLLVDVSVPQDLLNKLVYVVAPQGGEVRKIDTACMLEPDREPRCPDTGQDVSCWR